MSESPNRTAIFDTPPAVQGPQTSQKTESHSLLSWMGRTVPPLLIFAVLGSLLVWGHYTDWTIPKFSSLWGRNTDEKDDWCKEHGVPVSASAQNRPPGGAFKIGHFEE